jgi:hypothetical protein
MEQKTFILFALLFAALMISIHRNMTDEKTNIVSVSMKKTVPRAWPRLPRDHHPRGRYSYFYLPHGSYGYHVPYKRRYTYNVYNDDYYMY